MVFWLLGYRPTLGCKCACSATTGLLPRGVGENVGLSRVCPVSAFTGADGRVVKELFGNTSPVTCSKPSWQHSDSPTRTGTCTSTCGNKRSWTLVAQRTTTISAGPWIFTSPRLERGVPRFTRPMATSGHSLESRFSSPVDVLVGSTPKMYRMSPV